MICPKCGNEIKEGMVFCSKCGNQITGNKGANSNIKENAASEIDLLEYKKYIIIAVAAVLIIVLGKMILGGSGGAGGFSSFEDVIKAYISAMESRNEDDFLKCFPEDIRENVSKGIKASYEYGEDASHSPYRFMQAEDGYLDFQYMSDEEMSQDELDFYNEKYSYKASEGKYAEIKFSHSAEDTVMGGTAIHSNSVTVPVVKMGRKWYALEPQNIIGGWPLEY